MNRGLGTQLRHIIALLDGAVADSYDEIGLNYRPRFTPVMRALIELNTCTINQLAEFAEITQPAATQTVKLMVSADLISETLLGRLATIYEHQPLTPLRKLTQPPLPASRCCCSARRTG